MRKRVYTWEWWTRTSREKLLQRLFFFLVPLLQGENSPYMIPFCVSSKWQYLWDNQPSWVVFSRDARDTLASWASKHCTCLLIPSLVILLWKDEVNVPLFQLMVLWLVRSSHSATARLSHREIVGEKGTEYMAVAMCGLVCLKGDNEHGSDKTMETGLSWMEKDYLSSWTVYICSFCLKEKLFYTKVTCSALCMKSTLVPYFTLE